MLYKEKIYYDTLRWDDVFTDSDTFFAKLPSVGTVTLEADIKALYELLAMKYVGATTRYTDEFSFTMALKRELFIFYPVYLEQKQLLADMMALDIAEIMKAQSTLRNLVEYPNDPTPNADTVPISNLSTQQENMNMTTNKLDAIRKKYSSIARDYLNQLYKACDQLFTVILDQETFYIYEEVLS